MQLSQSIKKRYMKGGFITFSDTIKKRVFVTITAVYKKGCTKAPDKQVKIEAKAGDIRGLCRSL